jgi:hypothetical protein
LSVVAFYFSITACSVFEKKKVEEVAPVVEVKEDPTDPAPWLKRAQESFAQGNYSETIRNANEEHLEKPPALALSFES